MSEMKTVRIVGTGRPHDIHITDLEGHEIHATAVSFSFDARDAFPRASVDVVMPKVDVIAEAIITPRCPYCGRSDDGDGETLMVGLENRIGSFGDVDQ